MKILLCHNIYRYRGGEEVCVETLQNVLSAHGHKVIPFFIENTSIDDFKRIDKFLIPFRMLHNGRMSRQIAEIIKTEKPDVAHIFNLFPLISPSILKIFNRHRIPVIMTLNNFRLLCLNGKFLTNTNEVCERCKQGNFLPGIFRKCYRNSAIQSVGMGIPQWYHRVMKTYHRYVDLFVALNEFARSKFVEMGFPEEKFVVLPHFIPFDHISTQTEQGDYILFIGRLSEEKGILTLLEAFHNLSEYKLKIIGNGPMKDQLQSWVAERGMQNVEFLGYVSDQDKEATLQAAKFLVFPSECYEGMPYTILESFAFGIPIVASRIGALKELVEDGKNGLLFEKGDAADLICKIRRLMNDPKLLTQLRENASRSAEEKYSKSQGYRKLFNLYEKYVTRSKSGPLHP